MFCPKCATQNVEGASYCRACGANVSLIPQALTGQLPEAQPEDTGGRGLRHRNRNKPPTLEEGIKSLSMAVAFFVVSALVSKYAPGGGVWWFWMLIPAFTFLGKGISEIVRAKQLDKTAAAKQISHPEIASVNRMRELPPLNTNELMPPVPSVTEGTTRHLGAEAPTRHFDSIDSQK